MEQIIITPVKATLKVQGINLSDNDKINLQQYIQEILTQFKFKDILYNQEADEEVAQSLIKGTCISVDIL